MTSRRQAEANRRNALRSTGPRTPEGRAASSRNALTHGVLSTGFLEGHEDHDLFANLLEELVTEYEPETARESLLVERLAMLFWRERRLAIAEAEQADLQFFEGAGPYRTSRRHVPIMDQLLVGRYQGMLARQIKETLRDLRDERDSRLLQIDMAIDGDDGPNDVAGFSGR